MYLTQTQKVVTYLKGTLKFQWRTPGVQILSGSEVDVIFTMNTDIVNKIIMTDFLSWHFLELHLD